MPPQAVILLREAECMEHMWGPVNMEAAMELALQAAELHIRVQEEERACLTLEVQAQQEHILQEAALLVDQCEEEEQAEADLQEVPPWVVAEAQEAQEEADLQEVPL